MSELDVEPWDDKDSMDKLDLNADSVLAFHQCEHWTPYALLTWRTSLPVKLKVGIMLTIVVMCLQEDGT